MNTEKNINKKLSTKRKSTADLYQMDLYAHFSDHSSDLICLIPSDI